MRDRIYTPSDLAVKIVRYARFSKAPKWVADFAVGDGQLLRAAQTRWRSSNFVGTDINGATLAKLKNDTGSWDVGRCDFLNAKSRRHSAVLGKVKGKVSLVLLNPPFSCRGAKTVMTEFNGSKIKSSLALAFVLTAIGYLETGGQVIAIIPAGSLRSKKDGLAWKALQETCVVESLEDVRNNTFTGWSPRTSIVRITRLGRKRVFDSSARGDAVNRHQIGPAVTVFRGKISMHTLNGNSTPHPIPLVHTTELSKKGIDLTRHKIDKSLTFGRTIQGPSVLIQRVGCPNPVKIQIYPTEKPIALSDCIISINCKSLKHANRLAALLLTNWQLVESTYNGTCARYITVDSLCDLLLKLGVKATKNS